MVLEKKIKVVRKQAVKYCNQFVFEEVEMEVTARGCTEIELDREVERLKGYYTFNDVGIPRKSLDTHKVSTQNKSFAK